MIEVARLLAGRRACGSSEACENLVAAARDEHGVLELRGQLSVGSHHLAQSHAGPGLAHMRYMRRRVHHAVIRSATMPSVSAATRP